jgi:hypothetical protein
MSLSEAAIFSSPGRSSGSKPGGNSPPEFARIRKVDLDSLPSINIPRIPKGNVADALTKLSSAQRPFVLLAWARELLKVWEEQGAWQGFHFTPLEVAETCIDL